MSLQESDPKQLPADTLQRFKLYLPLLRLWKFKEKRALSVSQISEYLDIPALKVFYDFSFCSLWSDQKPEDLRVEGLIDCIEYLLGERGFKETLLIGVGRLGSSLLKNERLTASGLKIVAAFEADPEKVGITVAGIKIQNISKLPDIVRQMHLKIAMIATTPENALPAAHLLVENGMQVLWNFTPNPVELLKPGVIVQNTSSLNHLEQDYQHILSRL